MTKYTVGIDTGGTYTDAAIIDAQSHTVIAAAKAITTRGDLSMGVGEALGRALDNAGENFDRTAITRVSLSTTLATNALVEGHGSSVAAFLIGFDNGMVERTEIAKAVPSAKIVRINGGHLYTGQEQAPLDIDAIKQALEGAAGKVDAYSVSSNYSVRNPEHEHRAEALIREITGCPVTASCDLSDALNGPRRALTATFNARIISLIVALETAVQASIQQLGIDATIMIVKGDGSITSAESVIAKPIETILSGPAASVIGARYLAGESDFIISDIGGTTSDVATVRNGWPNLNEAGSDVGGFRTLVQAIDMQTVGLGGDSEVDIDFKHKVVLKANRVVPLSLVATRWPQVEKQLASALGKNAGMRSATHYLFRPEGASTGIYPADLNDHDREFLAAVEQAQPVLYNDMVIGAADRSRVPRLVDRGIIQISGFTPSDAAHVLNLQSQWSAKAAWYACELLGRATGKVLGMDPETEVPTFAREVYLAVVTKSSHLLLERLSEQRFPPDNKLVEAVTRGEDSVGDLLVSLKPKIPIVAVGGPAAVFYPTVGERLNCQMIIPASSEVANAIGAAIGMIKVRAVVEITSDDKDGYLVHHTGAPLHFSTSTEALAQAEAFARETAHANSLAMGGHDAHIEVSIKRIDIPGMNSESSLVGATVTAECVAAPED